MSVHFNNVFKIFVSDIKLIENEKILAITVTFKEQTKKLNFKLCRPENNHEYSENDNCFKKLKKNTIDFIATDPPYFIDGMDDKWNDDVLNKKKSKAKKQNDNVP